MGGPSRHFLNDRGEPNALTVVVHSWPEYADQISDFVSKINETHGLGLVWGGRGLSATTWAAFNELLLQKQRQYLTPEEKQQLCESQDGRCAMCKGICEKDDRELDHVIPVRNLLKGQEQILHWLSRRENKTGARI